MAIDQTEKQLNVASRLLTQAEAFSELLKQTQELVAEYAQAGTFTDPVFEGTALKHIMASDLATLVTRFNDILTYINASGRRDILRKVRQ